MNLQEKIDHSIALIRKTEKLALAMNDQGFYVGFSGGKDSQVLLELVKMAGVKYRSVYYVTTNDPVENVRFIKEQYPDVIFDRPKQSFFQLVAKKGLPIMMRRFCCAILKERAGVGFVVLTGVRAEESFKRSQYAEVQKWGTDKEIDLDKMEQAHFQCVGGKDKFMVYPILQWTEGDVWQFIRERGLPINPCYATQKRVGCVFCPFAPKRQIIRQIKAKPKQYQALLHNLQKFLDNRAGKGQLNQLQFTTAEEYFMWWINKENIKTYMEKKQQTTIPFEE